MHIRHGSRKDRCDRDRVAISFLDIRLSRAGASTSKASLFVMDVISDDVVIVVVVVVDSGTRSYTRASGQRGLDLVPNGSHVVDAPARTCLLTCLVCWVFVSPPPALGFSSAPTVLEGGKTKESRHLIEKAEISPHRDRCWGSTRYLFYFQDRTGAVQR